MAITAPENNFLNNCLLKGEWGFDGVLMSDWGATHSALGPARAGLDLEMPSGSMDEFEKSLAGNSRHGEITEQQINEKVRRILRMILRMGYLDRPQRDPSIPENDPESGKAALAIAQEGIVLLKNEKEYFAVGSGADQKDSGARTGRASGRSCRMGEFVRQSVLRSERAGWPDEQQGARNDCRLFRRRSGQFRNLTI